ncbi:hypothetical protein JCM11491_003551 [Sporobolomyces phaffii]
MARRKSKFMDYGSDSDSGDASQDDDGGDNDAHLDGFHPPSRGKKRTREQLQEDATYGIWADDALDRPRNAASSSSSSSSRPQQRKDYLAGQAFVAAGATRTAAASAVAQHPPPLDNLSTALAIEQARSDEEDVAMDLGDSSSSGSDSDADAPPDRHADNDNDENSDVEDKEDLAPVPGLDPAPTARDEPRNPAPPNDETVHSLGFAPRGLGAGRRGRGRGGLGTGTGTGGVRAGIASMSMFAAATSASSTDPAPAPAPAPASASPSSSGASTPRAGLGSRGGIGSRPAASLVDSLRAELNGVPPPIPQPAATTTTTTASTAPPRQPPAQVPHDSTPNASSSNSSSTPASAPGARRSFLPSAPPAPSMSTTKPKPLSRAESLHFSSLRQSNSVGLKLLEKMGWSAASGAGLGKDGTGIVVPLGEGQKLRKKGAGIQQGERTQASWDEEARRKGVSVDELMGRPTRDDSAAAARNERKSKKHKEAWAGTGAEAKGGATATRGSKRERKPKTEFKTYEEILAENGGDADGPRELLVDLSGNALPDQSISASLPSGAFGAGSADPTRLPELRHNLVLLTSTLSSHLRALAKEGSGVIARRAYLAAEEARVAKAVEHQATKMRRLEAILGVVERVKDKEREVRELFDGIASDDGPADVSACLERFGDEFDDLLGVYGPEYADLGLDQVVVGAITPICRRIFQTWDPLANPSLCVAQLKRYRKHFLIDKHAVASSNPGPNGAYDADAAAVSERRRQKLEAERTMTAFESFMWTVWLPKIRSAINNDWDASDPTPAVTLVSTWAPLLPAFLLANILDQLVLPKVSAAVDAWSASAYKRGRAPGLHTLMFPWLDVAGEDRMAPLVSDAKRRVRTWLKASWDPRDGVPRGFDAWRAAFSKSDWDALVLELVLPALGAHLRDRLVVNPRAQDLAPLDRALAWRPLVSAAMLGQLVECEVFPKWGDALWTWLTSDGVNLDEVAQWYQWWKASLPDDVAAFKGVQRGFRKGLDLMHQAMALGEDVKYRLKKPDFRPKPSSSSSSSTSRKPSKVPTSTSASTAPAASTTEVSFRSIVEDMCAQANLLFLATGRATATGRALYRVAESVDGRGGVVCYLEDDVAWVVRTGGDGDAEPVGIEELIARAKRGK